MSRGASRWLLAALLSSATLRAETDELAHPSGPLDRGVAHPTKLILGAGGVVRQRGTEDSRVEYGPSAGWMLHAKVVLLPWLGLRTSGGMEYLIAEVQDGALDQRGPAREDPAIAGPRIAMELEPSYDITTRLELFGRVGAAWFRPTVEAFELREPTPLTVSQRSGVLVEFPLGVGFRYALLPGRLGLAADASFDVAGPQSGALFDSGAGANQSVRQDTGELTRVDVFPNYTSAFGAGLSLELSF